MGHLHIVKKWPMWNIHCSGIHRLNLVKLTLQCSKRSSKAQVFFSNSAPEVSFLP